MASRISNAAAVAACNAIVDLIDVGGTGTLKIYTGAAPTNVEDAATGTLLADITLAATAFGVASDQNPNAQAALASTPVEDTNANATGTAGYFRFVSGGAVGVIQGACATSGAELNFNSTAISSGAIVSVTSFTVTVPEVGT